MDTLMHHIAAVGLSDGTVRHLIATDEAEAARLRAWLEDMPAAIVADADHDGRVYVWEWPHRQHGASPPVEGIRTTIDEFAKGLHA